MTVGSRTIAFLSNPARPGREQRYSETFAIRGAQPLSLQRSDALGTPYLLRKRCRGKMSYQVIARKWRPQSFDQLVGQNHISQTLQNALKNGRLPHALLFTGPRGTGKTSSARILAKSLRCPNAVNFQPCNVCQECQDITASRSIDVIEIDGA